MNKTKTTNELRNTASRPQELINGAMSRGPEPSKTINKSIKRREDIWFRAGTRRPTAGNLA
jgi:hypothetical protein